MSGVQCEVCDTITLDTCGVCHVVPLCKRCAVRHGNCGCVAGDVWEEEDEDDDEWDDEDDDGDEDDDDDDEN